jgi:hypothetical protein
MVKELKINLGIIIKGKDQDYATLCKKNVVSFPHLYYLARQVFIVAV